MRFRRKRETRDGHVQRYAAMLAETAGMEMSLGMDSWRDTIGQMNRLLDQLDSGHRETRTAEDVLINQMRQRINRLESVLHRREAEYDRLQERFCRLNDELAQLKK